MSITTDLQILDHNFDRDSNLFDCDTRLITEKAKKYDIRADFTFALDDLYLDNRVGLFIEILNFIEFTIYRTPDLKDQHASLFLFRGYAYFYIHSSPRSALLDNIRDSILEQLRIEGN
jgi:hypothetical protein